VPNLSLLIANLRHRAADALAASGTVARVALNLRPVYSSWGGGNQWLTQMVRYLRGSGYSVRFDLAGEVDCVLLTHFGLTGRTSFSLEALKDYLKSRPRVRVIHRVNDNDIRKQTAEMDRRLAQYDEVAHHTVFISAWLRDYHAARWFDAARPHSVIINGADAAVFHPIGGAVAAPGAPFRLVTHHWSDNLLKGFKVYAEVDRLISEGALPAVELWVIGRWPKEIQWRTARTFAPVNGEPLARLLRQCHAYLTASLWEPGGMHFIEGLQCGLPVAYHEDGGGIVEVASRFGVGFREDVGAAIAQLRERYPSLRRATLADPPSGDEMSLQYRKVVQQILADAPASSAPPLSAPAAAPVAAPAQSL
jgi:glycosyltransferase involved in cell wall biosynthesis